MINDINRLLYFTGVVLINSSLNLSARLRGVVDDLLEVLRKLISSLRSLFVVVSEKFKALRINNSLFLVWYDLTIAHLYIDNSRVARVIVFFRRLSVVL